MRESVLEIIQKSSTPEMAAMNVCMFFEHEVGGLAGNGWFDDDPEFLAETKKEHQWLYPGLFPDAVVS